MWGQGTLGYVGHSPVLISGYLCMPFRFGEKYIYFIQCVDSFYAHNGNFMIIFKPLCLISIAFFRWLGEFLNQYYVLFGVMFLLYVCNTHN